MYSLDCSHSSETLFKILSLVSINRRKFGQIKTFLHLRKLFIFSGSLFLVKVLISSPFQIIMVILSILPYIIPLPFPSMQEKHFKIFVQALYFMTVGGGLFTLACLLISMCRQDYRSDSSLIFLAAYAMLCLLNGSIFLYSLAPAVNHRVVYVYPSLLFIAAILIITDIVQKIKCGSPEYFRY